MQKGKYVLKLFHFSTNGELLMLEQFDLRLRPITLIKHTAQTISTHGFKQTPMSELEFIRLVKDILRPVIADELFWKRDEEPQLTWEKKVKEQINNFRWKTEQHRRYPFDGEQTGRGLKWSLLPFPNREDLLDVARVIVLEDMK